MSKAVQAPLITVIIWIVHAPLITVIIWIMHAPLITVILWIMQVALTERNAVITFIWLFALIPLFALTA